MAALRVRSNGVISSFTERFFCELEMFQCCIHAILNCFYNFRYRFYIIIREWFNYIKAKIRRLTGMQVLIIGVQHQTVCRYRKRGYGFLIESNLSTYVQGNRSLRHVYLYKNDITCFRVAKRLFCTVYFSFYEARRSGEFCQKNYPLVQVHPVYFVISNFQIMFIGNSPFVRKCFCIDFGSLNGSSICHQPRNYRSNTTSESKQTRQQGLISLNPSRLIRNKYRPFSCGWWTCRVEPHCATNQRSSRDDADVPLLPRRQLHSIPHRLNQGQPSPTRVGGKCLPALRVAV